ncbi:MAG: serine hydrolase domain-containing protein, partial [Candidatus Nanopelagicales bacterium]
MNIRRTQALAGIGLSSVLIFGAGAGSAMAQPTASLAKKASISTINKSKVMSAADKAAIDAAAAQTIAASPDAAPGLWVAVWDPKKGYYEQAYGNAVLPGTRATRADHFRIGSITKTVFATAVLQQISAGKLALSDTVKKLDPALSAKFPSLGKYTVAQLLSMRTQIPDYAEAAVDALVANSQKRFTREELIALGLEKGKPMSAAGGYSTTN